MFAIFYDAIRTQTSTVPFVRHTFIEVGDIGPGTAATRLPEREELLNHIGSTHAAALFGLGEAASGVALASALGELIVTARPVAVSASIHYLAKAVGPTRADAWIERSAEQLRAELQDVGKVRVDVLVSMRDEKDTQVATMSVTWHVSIKR